MREGVPNILRLLVTVTGEKIKKIKAEKQNIFGGIFRKIFSLASNFVQTFCDVFTCEFHGLNLPPLPYSIRKNFK